jgi:pyruvate formate-lyase activating enzyme-like uncharacterized protein
VVKEEYMHGKTQHIENTKRYVGWVYPELKWFTENEAEQGNKQREEMLESLSDERIKYASKESKIHSGVLSPGCMTCGEGTWSCLMINSLCTAHCFFCPQDRRIKKEKPPTAGDIIFDEADDYVDYLDTFGFKGVGFSGGESLLALDKLLIFIEKIKLRFGRDIYIWIYTNGDLVDAGKLERLKKAGLDEIRFNIVHKNYDLQDVELACSHMDTVTIEVPTIPEDYETLKERLLNMQNIGVAHLNLHQLHATSYNYRNFMKRSYTFMHYPSEYPVPIFESEMTALRLLKHAMDNNIHLPINYCSHVYKYRFQNAGARRRAALLGREAFEGITEAGFIRRLTVKESSANIKKLTETLRQNNADENLWSVDDTRTELSIHHSLLKYLCDIPFNLLVRYFDVRVNVQGHKEIALNSNRKLFIERQIVALKKLTSAAAESFCRLFIENADNKTQVDAQLLNLMGAWERISTGLAEVY